MSDDISDIKFALKRCGTNRTWSLGTQRVRSVHELVLRMARVRVAARTVLGGAEVAEPEEIAEAWGLLREAVESADVGGPDQNRAAVSRWSILEILTAWGLDDRFGPPYDPDLYGLLSEARARREADKKAAR